MSLTTGTEEGGHMTSEKGVSMPNRSPSRSLFVPFTQVQMPETHPRNSATVGWGSGIPWLSCRSQGTMCCAVFQSSPSLSAT